MRVIVYAAYFIGGLMQWVAITAGLHSWIGLNNILCSMLAFPVSYIPIVGTITGIWGAMSSLHWSWYVAFPLFLWPFIIIALTPMISKFIDSK